VSRNCVKSWDIQLKRNTPDGIVLEDVVQAEIKNLDLERSGQRDLIRRHTQNITIEYVSLRDRP
jgi:hypothetical protein